MRRVLLVETASPKRVRKKAEELLAENKSPAPEITILCRPDPGTIRYFCAIPGVQVVSLNEEAKRLILNDLNHRNFDVVLAFWTGEKRYRSMKLFALRLRAGRNEIDIGDGNVFLLTLRAFVRFWIFRLRHPLPTDHWAFVPRTEAPVAPECYEGEKILLIQSAEPPYVLAALHRLRERRLFRKPRYSLFCRDRTDIVSQFVGHPMIHEIRTHAETRGSWKHFLDLRRERFEAAVVFFTGDPGYWKIKLFAFLLGARHKLIFNENNDCFFFSWGSWITLLAHRMGERARQGTQPRWTHQTRFFFFLLVKLSLLPFRFVWLLLVWLRLRAAGLRVLSSIR